MSLLALGQVLEGRFDYSIVDGNLVERPIEALNRAIESQQARILGVTVMPGPQLLDAVGVCQSIKSRHPEIQIVWGGYFPSQQYTVCLNARYVDYVVCGHGEFVFVDLVDRLLSGESPNDLPGLAYRNLGSGEVVKNPDAPIPHPKDLPELFPYHRLDVERYLRRTFLGKRTLPHHSSYGCPFFCNFCAVVNMVNGRWKAQTSAQIFVVVAYLVRNFRADAIEFYDNNFFTSAERVEEFCERLVAAKIEIGWWGEARIDTMMKYSDRLWYLLRKTGLKMVFLGAESGSDETLQRMNKGGTASTEKTLAIAHKMKAYGIIPEMSFVLGNPPDPERDLETTLSFIRRVKKVNPRTEIVLYPYTPVPLAGELYEQARAFGFNFPDTLEGWIDPIWQDISRRRSTELPWIKDPFRRRMLDFQRVLNAYYPTATDLQLSPARRAVLRAVSAWRYHSGWYRWPQELRLLQRLFAYQRPETSGF